ncbi:Qat anti-phage system QueC-like protein QatC [Emticicia sp. 17c]|uniref:Qat anti-phage system QueC-like protein QatC n=1 Tax=Emticicia sp. 17c TaxID=3127704 RepID=UPI00301BE56B
MGKLALIALVGETDKGLNLDKSSYVKIANLPMFKNHNATDVSVHEFIDALKRFKLEPTELVMDLLVIASTMYGADTRIKREIFAEDSWTRQIDLYIPVSDPDFWDSQKKLLEKIFRFLTGDIWDVTFRKRSDPDLKLAPVGKLARYGMPYETDTVCLFSGGMDSFIGAVDLLESGTRPLLVGHSKSSDVTLYQNKCFDALKQYYTDNSPERIYAFLRIPKEDLFEAEDHTERGRSFLFLSLGAICASTLNQTSNLIVPENGMISLNIPLTPLRTGSHSTRTTHPYYLQMMQMLFNSMQIGVTIKNPYQFVTKGEMLKNCLNQKLVIQTETMSCSHPSGRWDGQGNGHCGYCVPCLIRQASFKAAGVQDPFPYRKDIFSAGGLDITQKEGADVLAFKYMIEKVNAKPDYLTAAIRNTGPLGEDVTPYVEVYRRSLNEVENLIKSIVLR